MPDTTMTWASVAPAVGEIFLTCAICAVLLIDVFAGDKRRGLTGTLTLIALAEARPATDTELLAISGVGRTKLERYGADVLAICAGASGTSSTLDDPGRPQAERGS